MENTTIRLPEEFTRRMRKLLMEEEYAAFLKSYEGELHRGLRVNTGKISVEDFLEIAPFSLRPIPWVKEGFYYEETQRPGRHPYHEAGLYYIQEPSAMAVAVLADPQPGERVLDLCGAPGGKTTQLAGLMRGKGLLVANEIHPARAKILAQNVERMGIPHALVTNESPQTLAGRFPAFFDRVVVDAPCSGEGMFRKEEQALLQWSPENVSLCAGRQDEILEAAAAMVRPGGRLVYSTCTFAPEEDEGSVSRFLKSHGEFHVEKIQAYEGFSHGRPEWVNGPREAEDTYRVWPHLLEGEGHYMAVLGRDGDDLGPEKDAPGLSGKRPSFPREYKDFERENLACRIQGFPVMFGEQLYAMPEMTDLKGLRALRAGLHLGTLRKGRFEPSHALALALKAGDALRTYSLAADKEQVRAYLRGETLPAQGEKGWCLVLVDGYSLGWGKISNGVLKNHYPKGLRWT